jgi:hypothetical protein
MTLGKCPWLATCLVLALATGVAAQPAAGDDWSRGTTINLFAGAASASSTLGPLAGGAVGWEVTPRFGVEGSAAWLDRGRSAAAFAAALSAHLNLRRPRTTVPFIMGGIGLYRVSFDVSRDAIPDFYGRRLGAGETDLGPTRTFTDPALVAGAGVNVFATRKWAIRPQVQTMVVRRHSRSHPVTAVTLHVAYHLEEHPITPAAPSQRAVHRPGAAPD